jgi:hypothetical protein
VGRWAGPSRHLLLLLFGAGYGVLSDPTLLGALREVHITPRLPTFALGALTLDDFLLGAIFLALPQVPLTLGNAVIAITEENNRLFPDRLAMRTGFQSRPAS